MMAVSSFKEGKAGIDPGKYVRYTLEQVEALERLYLECPKPSSMRRQQLIRECPILSNIEPKQIKVWFQNRRCREKQRKESLRLQAVNRKLSAMNKLLMEENDRLQKQVSHLVYENGYFRQRTRNAALTTTDTSCESVVTSSQHCLTSQHLARDVSPAGLMSVAEETLTEFLSKATGTAVKWVQLPGMKPGPDSIGIISISHGCTGVAARACGLVGLEPTKVAEILKDRSSWCRDCRSVDIVNVLPTANGGTIELIYVQLYAPTTLAPARDFWLLRYTSALEDGSLVVCERSLSNIQGATSMLPTVQPFVRAEVLPSGYLIRPCDGGGSVIHIVDHFDLEPWSVPEVVRPLYESSTVLAQKSTMAAFRQLRQIAHEAAHGNAPGWGRRPAAHRALGQRLMRGFNEAVNGFTDDGWSVISNDCMDDVTILVNSSPSKMTSLNVGYANAYSSITNSVLCAKASMLLQNVSPAMLLRFLREHRSEWADWSLDIYSAEAVKATPCTLPISRPGCFGGQVILPLAHTLEHEEFLEIIKLESIGHPHEVLMPRELFLLQLCSGVDEKAVGSCSELVFAPIDASFADDVPLLSSGFRVIPLDSTKDTSSPNRTLDLASALEVKPAVSCASGDNSGSCTSLRSVMTIAFQFAFENHLQAHVASLARQYVRNIIGTVQRVALAISPSNLGPHDALLQPLGSLKAIALARWICYSYRLHTGIELLKPSSDGSESLLKMLWHHSDAIICCSLKAVPQFTFSNQAGLDMLETTLVALKNLTLEKFFDEQGGKLIGTQLPHIIQQGFVCLEAGLCVSSMGRPVSYERGVAWKVMDEEEKAHCLCFMFVNWSFV